MICTVRWILLRIIFRTACKLHMYVFLKYEPTETQKQFTHTHFCKFRIRIIYCRMCFYCKLWLLAIITVPHILVKHVLCSEYVQISCKKTAVSSWLVLMIRTYSDLHRLLFQNSSFIKKDSHQSVLNSTTAKWNALSRSLRHPKCIMTYERQQTSRKDS